MKEFEKEILYWIVLTDQWPFQMSYILFLIEEADQKQNAKINDGVSLCDIYET